MSKDLLYRPDLSYDKSYYTEGNILKTPESDNSSSGDKDYNLNDKVDNIKDILDEIKSKLPILPEDILDVFLPPFIIVDGVINDMINDKDNLPNIEPVPEPDIEPVYPPDINPEFPTPDNELPEDPFGREEDIYIDIPITVIPEDVELEHQYLGDLTDILEDYLIGYDNTLDKYITNVMTYLSDSKFSNLKLIATKELEDENLSHISDYLIKSKIVLKQQLNLYKKMFDMDETIFHIRSVKVANEQRKRYKKNKRIDEASLMAKSGNDLLKESIMVSEKKYEENFYGLYKYLNSSVILFNECINTVIKQKQSLVLLNNREREK